MNEDIYTISSGMLDVGDGHQIYYQQWGNKNSDPIFYLHGGPGGGCSNKYKKFFDPKKHNVIFHDQRGSGLSTPHAEIDNNTTDKLVEDIELLRKFLKIDQIRIIGGSWGSCLALIYAIKHPQNVAKMLIWGIFTGAKNEVDYIQQGGLKTHFPEAWEQYIELVPENERGDTVKFYLDKFINGTDDEKIEFTRRWVCLEVSAMSIDADYSETLYSVDGSDEKTRALAILEAHYFINNCFIPENYVMDNVDILKTIPIVMVQGRFDHVTPPQTAYNLSKALGENCILQFVPASHGREGALREAVRAHVYNFLK